jgi:hypothetical protein
VAQLLIDENASARNARRLGLQLVTARRPRDVGGQPAESLLYFFSPRGGTFQLACQPTDALRRRLVSACMRVTQTVEVDRARVRLRGFEPPRACAQWLLKPSRMPVSPQPRDAFKSSAATT